MTGDNGPRKGDRVRVSYEATFDAQDIYQHGDARVVCDDKESARVPVGASVEVVAPALCGETEGATGIRCQSASGHVGVHKGTTTERQTAAVGYPLFVSWPGETVVVTSDARRSVGVVNEPHGLPVDVRQQVAAHLIAGSMRRALGVLQKHGGMSDENALAYIGSMPEYQSYLSEHGHRSDPLTCPGCGSADPDVRRMVGEVPTCRDGWHEGATS